MKDELPTILEAIRAAQAELAAYLDSADRNAELTIAKLVGILERREVVRAMRLLRARARGGRAAKHARPGELTPLVVHAERSNECTNPARGHSGGATFAGGRPPAWPKRQS
jgi:hypothetical protein